MNHKLLLVPMVFVLGGCPLLDVEVDVGEVCMTYKDFRVEGAAPGTATATDQMFTFDDLGPVHELVDKLDDADIEFTRATLRATSGITGFDFVHAAHLSIASGDPSSALPLLTVLDCDGDCLGDTGTLAVPASVQHDAVEYVRGDSLAIAVQLEGEPPTEAWSMDVDVCMNGRAAYSYDVGP
jgi:hypothetical protein